MVIVEEVLEKEPSQTNSPAFNAIVVAESSSGVAVLFKVSI
jgi:hypothetical protein